ncbi:hypothetical protein PG993_002839 [Apiospora rasikravindrae]|uniref:Uncharacterized protein n=1 Tax=Apiospora rasikravindrae TaxID=990691 RepID=A0ABR1U0J2_9PEZI
MENIPSPSKAQPETLATQGQALTFRAANRPGSVRDKSWLHQGKQIVQDDGFVLGNKTKPFDPVFRTPELLDDDGPSWYQEGHVLPRGEEAGNNYSGENLEQNGGSHLPVPVSGPLSPVPWGRLGYRTQAVILKALTSFYRNELFPFQTACEALQLYRHEADEFVARHLSEWNEHATGEPYEHAETMYLDRSTAHVASKFMKGQGLPQEAVAIVMQWSSHLIRWPMNITNDGFPMAADPFTSSMFPSSSQLSWYSSPAPLSFPDHGLGEPPGLGQSSHSQIQPPARPSGFLQFALIPGEEGTPHGVRFTEVVLPRHTLVCGPRSVYTLHHAGRYLIEYPDWCRDYTTLNLSHFSFVEGRQEGASSTPQHFKHRLDDFTAYFDRGAQDHHSSPLSHKNRAGAPVIDYSRGSNSHGSLATMASPTPRANPRAATAQTFGTQNTVIPLPNISEPTKQLIEAMSRAMPGVDYKAAKYEQLNTVEGNNKGWWETQQAQRFWVDAETKFVSPKNLLYGTPVRRPFSFVESPEITPDKLAGMPTGPIVRTNTPVIGKPASYEPYLTIRLPPQYYVIGPTGHLITFDGDFGDHSAPTACNLDGFGQPCRHGKLPYGLGGVYSFHLPLDTGVRYTQDALVTPQLPEAVHARFSMPGRYALYRDDFLMPRATAPGTHELRKVRKLQRINGTITKAKTTMDLMHEAGQYMILNDMAPYRKRILPSFATGANASSKSDEPSSGDEEDEEELAAAGATKSMPQHMQNTLLEAHRILGPHREQFEAELEEEGRQEILAEKRELAREKARAMKEHQEEKKKKALRRQTRPSRVAAPAPEPDTPGSNSGQQGRLTRAGTGIGMGLVSFSDDVLKRQIESSSSSSSDDERTLKKKQKYADRLDRIPDDDDDDDDTFSTSRWGRKITMSTKAQEQQAPVTRRAAAPRTASTASAATTKKSQAPTPASERHQIGVATPTPASQSRAASAGNSSPLKKKRGRPRKHPLPGPVKTQTSSSPAKADNSQSSAEASSSIVVNTSGARPQSRTETNQQARADSGNDTQAEGPSSSQR